MNIYGLTPVDALLSAQGLDACRQILKAIFLNSPIGLVAFMTGFFLSLARSLKEGHFKAVAVLVFISLVILLIFVLPYRQESAVKSAVDVYGHKEHSLESKPVELSTVFSFIVQGIDSVSLAVIFLLDNSVDAHLRFLSAPFSLHSRSVDTHRLVVQPLEYKQLRQDVEAFMYAVYLPSLIRCRKQGVCNDSLVKLWPGHSTMLSLYSSVERKRWDSIEKSLHLLIHAPQGGWEKTKQALSRLMMRKDDIDEDVFAAILRNFSSEGMPWWMKAAYLIIQSFPYVYGWANYVAYIVFPLMLLALLVMTRLEILLAYTAVLVWVKSWLLGAAIAYYVSLMAAKVQGELASDSSWFWEYPYFLGAGAFLLILVPVISLVIIYWISSSMCNRS